MRLGFQFKLIIRYCRNNRSPVLFTDQKRSSVNTLIELLFINASGDYDDIINDALNYYDTADQACEDGIAMNILDYEECVPNFMSILEEIPEVKADLLTLEGRVLNFPNLQLPLEEVATGGFLIRQDWLDALGMDIPQTYDEMHDVMAAFQSEYGATDPYVMPYQVLSPWGMMAGGFGITATANANNFYLNLENDTVELATISDAYYDYLSMFRDWYDEGIINPDFTSQTMNVPDQNIIASGTIIDNASA